MFLFHESDILVGSLNDADGVQRNGGQVSTVDLCQLGVGTLVNTIRRGFELVWNESFFPEV